ncbi:hypothetical protein NDU88_004844 [Pleurodeles waltl]|uniref:Uncharacterized protein n=1 Tax=Pleurodeles waltl TaxID=8319 RepID=A0AAV7W909_PLEWA|nr:hypothetical protein NDU88_004844 [Pleurodeles waltl]
MPDFWVPRVENREDGRQWEREKEDAVEPKETARADRDKHKRSSGNPDVPRAGADPVEEERSEDTRGSCHVPGGAWLIKHFGMLLGRFFERFRFLSKSPIRLQFIALLRRTQEDEIHISSG